MAGKQILKGPRFYNRAGLAEIMGLGMVALDQLLKRQNDPIPSLRIGHKILIPCDQFELWVANECKKPTEEKFCLDDDVDEEE